MAPDSYTANPEFEKALNDRGPQSGETPITDANVIHATFPDAEVVPVEVSRGLELRLNACRGPRDEVADLLRRFLKNHGGVDAYDHNLDEEARAFLKRHHATKHRISEEKSS